MPALIDPVAGKTWLQLGLRLLIAAAGVGTLAGFAGRKNWLLDLASHFRLHYLLALGGAGYLGAILEDDLATGAAVILGMVNLVLVLPLYRRLKKTPAQGRRYRLFLANVYQPNQKYDLVRQQIAALAPDFVVLVETNSAWLEALATIQERLPHRWAAVRDDHYGMVIYSRYPFCQTERPVFNSSGTPSLQVTVDLENTPLTLIATHPPPPKGSFKSELRNNHLAALAAYIRDLPGERMVCGDLNISPWSVHFQRFLKLSGLADSAQGFGVQATWPAWLRRLGVPIDHCLVSRGVGIRQRRIGRPTGSDHLPVIVDFSLAESQYAAAQTHSTVKSDHNMAK